ENSVIVDIKLLVSHAMIKAQAKDYVRENQIRLILRPVAEQMLIKFEKKGSERRLQKLLSQLHERSPQTTGYAAGNILNLLVQLNVELQDYDFSYLPVRQAYLQDVLLRDVNFAYADMSGSVFSDNFGSIFSVALSQDGKWLAAGTANGEVRVWDANNAEAVLVLSGHTEWVRSVAFSPDGKCIASGSEDKTIRIWDINSGDCLNVLVEHEGTVYSVVFSPDGDSIASGSEDKTIRIWDINSGNTIPIRTKYY